MQAAQNSHTQKEEVEIQCASIITKGIWLPAFPIQSPIIERKTKKHQRRERKRPGAVVVEYSNERYGEQASGLRDPSMRNKDRRHHS